MVTQIFKCLRLGSLIIRALLFFSIGWHTVINAQERLRVGPVYPIAEQDMLDVIKAKLAAKKKSGELAKIEKEAIERSKASMENPRSLDIPRTFKARTHFFDPSITVTTDIKTPDGQLIAAAGTQFNPLDMVNWAQKMLFFDASDEAQVAYAKAIMKTHDGQIKPVLTGGSYMALMRSWKELVYFDQGAILTKKFGITQVPALVAQEGKRLRIDEVVIR
jgi:conjugal transfer pilus assembly protein TraW